MSSIVIVGGHGKVALLLARELSARGHTVRSLIRAESHGADIEAAGAVPYLLDIESSDAGDFADAFGGADTIVFAAGAGGSGGAERKRTVDLEGSLKSIDAAGQAGVRRFVQVSAISVDEPLPADTEPVWRAYVEAKRDADAALRASTLDWTIVRPGALTDDDPTGHVRLGATVPRDSITRADVAALLATVIENDSTIDKQFEATNGDLTIPDALAAML